MISIFMAICHGAIAQSTNWDGMLENSQWCVPSPNLLAYLSSPTNLSTGIPFADQTTWDVTNCVNGYFSGTTALTGTIGSLVILQSSNTILSGLIDGNGQVRIQFTGTNGSVTTGIGQARTIDGTNTLEMQMITGGGTNSYITHWAYMVPYSGSTVPPTTLPTNSNYLSYQSRWIDGTTWSIRNTDVFGTSSLGSFRISGYTNGYFFGSGAGPEGGSAANFTINGSVTPEGNLLFNLLNSSNGIMTSLTGALSGGPADGAMGLRTYTFTNSGSDAGVALVTGSSNLYVGFTNSGQTTDFNAGTNSYHDTYLGYGANASNNQLLVSGSTTVLSNTGTLFVGYEGSANSLVITNGAKVFGTDAYISAFGGSNNTVIISGPGSAWSNSGSVQVAKSLSADVAGTGTLTLMSGGSLDTANLIISGATNSVGTVEVGLKGGSDSNMTLNAQMITFGDGTGSLGLNQSDTLTISGSIVGATATNSYAMIQQYGSGTTVLTGISHTGTGYRVDGGQLKVDGGIFDIVLSAGASPDELGGARTVCVGNKYSGKSLVITNGGYVHSFVTIIGTGTQKNTDALTGTSNNWALVTGNSSRLDAGELLVGNVSSGNSLMISNGASVTSSLMTSIGASGSSNSVVIDGTGSFFSNAGSLELGSFNQSNVSSGNTILVTNGGGFASGTATIGSSTNSFGNSVVVAGGSFWTNSGDLSLGNGGSSNNSILVTGTSSTLRNGSNLSVGLSGSGTLTVANGASVITADLTIAASNATVGTLNIGALGGSDTAGHIMTPSISFGSGTGTINFNQSDTAIMTSSISGAGTIQQLGTGTTILSGSNSCSGMTLVKAGTLLVNNTAGSALGISTVLVTNTGTFGGNGTIGGPLSVGNGGSLTPGFNGSGSLALSDGLALQDGSITSLLINSTTNYTSLVIQGGALTYGGTLQLNLTPYVANASPGDIFSLFSTWGGVTINTNDFSNIQVIGASFTFTDYSGLWIGTDINDNLTYQFSDATGMLTVSSVPEPSTYALFGIGAIGMLMEMRRKKMPEGAR